MKHNNANALALVELEIRTLSTAYLCGNWVPFLRKFNTGDKFKKVRCTFSNSRFYLFPPGALGVYMLSQGKFEIYFDACKFFKIMNGTSEENIKAFWNHAVLKDLSQLAAFGDLLLKAKWSDKKKLFARALMAQLEKQIA